MKLGSRVPDPIYIYIYAARLGHRRLPWYLLKLVMLGTEMAWGHYPRNSTYVLNRNVQVPKALGRTACKLQLLQLATVQYGTVGGLYKIHSTAFLYFYY